MRNFTLFSKVGFLTILLCSNFSAFAEGLKGTFFMKATEFIEGATSAYGNVYLDGVEIIIAEADPDTSWDLTVTNLCGQGTTYGGTVSEDGTMLTLSMLGNCYFSDRDYADKGTESLGGADSTIMGSLAIELLEDGSLKFSDFTVINTVISGAPVSTALATYKGTVAVPVTSYHFKAASYTAGEASIYGNEYPAEFDFTLRRCIETDNYDVAVTNLCNQGTTFYATATERTICPDLCFGLEDVTLHPNILERQGNRMVSFRVLALFCNVIGYCGIIAFGILPLFKVLIII